MDIKDKIKKVILALKRVFDYVKMKMQKKGLKSVDVGFRKKNLKFIERHPKKFQGYATGEYPCMLNSTDRAARNRDIKVRAEYAIKRYNHNKTKKRRR